MDDGVRVIHGSKGPVWTHALLRSQTGTVQQTINNCILAIQHLEPWKSEGCWYDSVRERHMIGTRPVEDLDAIQVGAVIEQAIHMRVNNLHLMGHALDYVCRQTTRDLLREWVDSLPDATPTTLLTTWLRMYANVPAVIPDAYVADVSLLIPVGMIARIFNPGCQYRYVPIFEGDEDMGKSNLTKALAGSDQYGQSWHVALSAGMEGKEAHMMLEGALIAELEELSSYTKTDENRMKALVTMQMDSFVPKFSNKRVDHPRRTIFIATVNPEGDGAYLKSQTGNTRWLPLKVGAIDVQGFLAQRTSLFAEAKAYYLAHPQDWWRLTSGAEATTEREVRRQKSVYEGEKLEAWLYALRVVGQVCTWDEVAEKCFEIPKDRWNRALQMEIAKALKASGWISDRTTTHRYWKPL
jgi:putative DNA primase/helicase